MSASATPPTVIAQLVETMRTLAGSHPGFRPVHAKGVVCSGIFRGAPQARGVSRALHLQGQTVPTVIRFSNSSGNPDVHDGVANARALAVKFQLPGGKNADVLALSIEGFPARTPEDFLAFLRAQLPDPVTGQPAPDAVSRFLEGHPATRAFLERLMQKACPRATVRPATMPSMPFGSLPRMAPADSAVIAGCPRQEKPTSPPTMQASAARTSCVRNWRAAYETVWSSSASSCNWLAITIRRMTSPPCGRRTDR
jgi:hypothetical protein